jgi:7-cyano-7-deazaguanine synthase
VGQRIFGLEDINLPSSTVLLSGGIDSSACLQFLLDRHHEVSALFIDYGQAAAERERLAAGAIANHFDVHLLTMNVTGGRSFSNGELPGRNAFLIATGLFFGAPQQNFIAIGIHAGTPYYDCSLAFIDRMGTVVAEHTNGACTLLAPFKEWTKSQIAEYVVANKLPHEKTYSCEAGTIPVCGRCLSCLAVRGAIGLISARPWVWFDGEAGAESGGRESST